MRRWPVPRVTGAPSVRIRSLSMDSWTPDSIGFSFWVDVGPRRSIWDAEGLFELIKLMLS